ncbi:hypothetical protein EYZ11_011737 [Aspergillus tanneri]|uniref:Uncharacterized protein n=1 Tax=Aspergillus tanneri TaxID=1220188 RepID=A0A4S3J216_9EURO|nr:hypothetical protein EYZ11_011737 [Aspergillus tanneri]
MPLPMDNAYVNPRAVTAVTGQGQAEVSAAVDKPTTQRAPESPDCPGEPEEASSPPASGHNDQRPVVDRDSVPEDARTQDGGVHVSGLAGSAGSDPLRPIPLNNHSYQPYMYYPYPYNHFYPYTQQYLSDEQPQPPFVGQPNIPGEVPPTAPYLPHMTNLVSEAEPVSYQLGFYTNSMVDLIVIVNHNALTTGLGAHTTMLAWGDTPTLNTSDGIAM